jgi:hypothetical protein
VDAGVKRERLKSGYGYKIIVSSFEEERRTL